MVANKQPLLGNILMSSQQNTVLVGYSEINILYVSYHSNII